MMIISIAAGKGGVGKSTIAVHLALSLKKLGFQVGLLDADIYGPSLHQLMPADTLPRPSDLDDQRLIPATCRGVELMSAAYFMQDGQAAAVRAPIANALVEQFVNTVDWGALDFLLIDFPPGTGDIQLTLMQKSGIMGALIVTTPQKVALLDVRRSAEMFVRMHVPILGVVENMSFLELENGEKQLLFGEGGGRILAEEFNVPFLGEIPFDPRLSMGADEGRSIFDLAPTSACALAFEKIALSLTCAGKEDEFQVVVEGDKLFVAFNDGSAARLPLSTVQSHCPCMRCRSNSPKINEEVTAHGFSKVGHYGVQLTFSSGCSLGIYSIEKLKELAGA